MSSEYTRRYLAKFYARHPHLAPDPQSIAARVIASAFAILITGAAVAVLYLTPGLRLH
ncbi:MAG TPA: hypothetical protein VJ803_06855 [Gemmatimonadaceae bacterium]|jgi:hypothetical protein|nr:hypothetical protein [Gemmatimonadaceae bacterium]